MSDTVIVALIGAAVTFFNVLFTVLSNTRKKKSAVEIGVQCLLRAYILDARDKYMHKKYCPIYAREALTMAYNAYHKLGGNDVATDLYEQTIALPTEPEEANNE